MEVSNKVPEIEKVNPLISIVVPAYNIEKYLPACLNSILEQSYENIEIVLIDDGSVDRTGQIADEYKEKYPAKIKCIHLKNGGVMNARMTGIKVASGDWIGFVDGDDTIESDMYKRLIDNALTYQADISHCGYQTIVNGGERIHYFYNTGRLVEQDEITGLKDLLAGSFVEPGLWNKLFHKTLFHSLLHDSGMPVDVKINEDLLMNYFLFKEAKKSVYEDFCPYHYMTRSTSATRSEFKEHKVLDPMRVKRYILDDVRPELKDIAWRKYLISCLNACDGLYGKNKWKTEYFQARQDMKVNRDKWELLSRNEQIKLKLFMLSAWLYKFIFRIYEKYFQKKIYE